MAIALAQLGLLLATAGRYGYHRDELYFVEAGKHPALGYDDQPPLTPLLGRISAALFGQTPRGIRVLSAFAIALCVVLTALIARELGGRRRAQVIAAGSLAASGVLALGHLLSTATFDFLAWTTILFLVTRILGGGDRRLWLATGLVAGVALLNKYLVLLLLGSLALGAVATRRRDLLRSPPVWLAVLLAALLAVPNLVWQARHGWPQLTLAHQISGEDPSVIRLTFLPFQLLFVSPFLVPVWIAGLLWLLRRGPGRRFRLLGWGYLALVAVCLLTAAKGYYAAGYYPLLVAAGGVAIEGWLVTRARRGLLIAAIVAAAAGSAFFTLPLVPERTLPSTPIAAVNEDAIESIGWTRFVDTIARVYGSIPPAERRRAVIFTGNYGEAGAIERFGPSRGLPRAYSGHNSFAQFGRPPDDGAPVVVVGVDRRYLGTFLAGCRPAARIDNGVGVDNEEQGKIVWLCRRPRESWRRLWPRLHHLDA